MNTKIQTLIEKVREAKLAVKAQEAKVWDGGRYNGRYSPKHTKLVALLRKAERELLKAI
jgi:hypothetical protein